MGNRCVIVGGAEINNYDYIKKQLHESDFIIFCDSGLKHSASFDVTPSLIVGDFDSYNKPETKVEIITLPSEKDDTDTVFAAKEGIRRGFDNFLLLGVVGARLDHTLGNVYILQFLDSLGKTAKIIDDFSEMEIVSNIPKSVDDSFSYFSLLNITGEALGVNISNAKYPLSNAEIKTDYQYGISNEVVPGKTSEISVEKGKLLLIKIR